MLPAILAIKPAIRYGLMIGVPVALLLGWSWYMYSWGYDRGEHNATALCQESLAQKMSEMGKQVIEARQMEAQVVKSFELEKAEIERKADELKRKVDEYGKTHQPVVLTRDVIDFYNSIIRLPNEIGQARVPSANPGSGTSEVQGGAVQTQAVELIPLDIGDGTVLQLTRDELQVAAVDAMKTLARIKADYKGLNEFNEGREALEIRRLQQDE